MHPVPRCIRRLGMAALAVVALGAAAQAAPAQASTGFGAGNLPGKEITEGGTVDYSVTLPACPQGVECNLFIRATSGHAVKGVDFTSSSLTPLKTYRGPADGPMSGVVRIKTIDDKLRERDEPLWFEARVDYYPGGCPNGRPGSSASCLPASEFRWLGIVTILDNDKSVLKPWSGRLPTYRLVRAEGVLNSSFATSLRAQSVATQADALR